MTEAYIHRAVRRYLRAHEWTLVAGQWPGGSDDELHVLNIVDPLVARDFSPDPRRHSNDKFVPDVVALKGRTLLITEAKPTFSRKDFLKLDRLLGERRADLFAALQSFGRERGFDELVRPDVLTIIPALAFEAVTAFPQNPRPWVMLLVEQDGNVAVQGHLP